VHVAVVAAPDRVMGEQAYAHCGPGIHPTLLRRRRYFA